MRIANVACLTRNMDTIRTQTTERGSVPDAFSLSTSTQSGTVQRNRLASTALILALLAAVATILCSVIVGLGLGPLQARDAVGEGLAGDSSMLSVYYALLLSNILWTVAGTTGLVLGIVALKGRTGRSRAVAAIIVAIAAPIVSFTVWSALTLLTSPLS